jgi:small-conductance mechanosensitive channel
MEGTNALIAALQDSSISFANITISAFDIVRFVIISLSVLWVSRRLDKLGHAVIQRQSRLDFRTREVMSKVFRVLIISIVAVIFLHLLGVNLTTLAVFSGAVGVGLGLGLQSIASNFISGVIILVDRSITLGDYIELEDGNKGFVREFRMRYTVLETYDGKDIVVPNEKFISSLFINWTHKDPKQRYRVDFTVAFNTDIHQLAEQMRLAIGQHPQVLTGTDASIEEQPDCEIDSFGDSGINMFVEFWMLGVDDGKNRVGGDVLLIILDTLRSNNIEIPFPQREVRILKAD